MPYIKKEDRRGLQFNNYGINVISVDAIDTAGELQYAIAVMIKSYMDRKGLNYQNCNDIMGALTGANMEFYRRVVAKYEDEKIESNGDVY